MNHLPTIGIFKGKLAGFVSWEAKNHLNWTVSRQRHFATTLSRQFVGLTN